MIAQLPPQLQERVVCSIVAAVKYEVPANIVLAVAEKEGGKAGQWVKNSNGTYDVGAMQLNTSYLKDLKKYGITPEDAATPGCYSFDLAAWRLRGHLQHDSADVWTRAANYHSRTPKYNRIYRTDLIKKAQKWGTWLEARFETYPVVTAEPTPLRFIRTQQITKQPQVTPITTQPTKYNPTAASLLNAYFAQNPMRGFS